MCLFRKKKRQEDPALAMLETMKCLHKFQDFPWYIEGLFKFCDYDFNYGKQTISIYKPYVCIHCKERKDVLLQEMHNAHMTEAEGDQWYNAVRKQYAEHIKPRPVVEAMINDMQLVDREYLELAKLYHPELKLINKKETDNEKKED